MQGRKTARTRRAIGVALVATLALVLGACDWSQPRYDPALTGYNPTESQIGIANAATLVEAWRGTTGSEPLYERSPIVANGTVFIAETGPAIDAFSANAPNAQCSGAPRTCTPARTYVTGSGASTLGTPSIEHGVLYGAFDAVYAFDATGTTNCTGSPSVCSPLWQTNAVDFEYPSSPTIANGVLYVAFSGSDTGEIDAYDAAGVTNCAGTPKVCQPLWTAPVNHPSSAPPAVANGFVYVTTFEGIEAFFTDPFGCTGTPLTCTHAWSAPAHPASGTSAAVSDDFVYVATSDDHVLAFDDEGDVNCFGSPATCQPIWSGTLNGTTYTSPAVANGVVYVGSAGLATFGNALYAFDAHGITNCSSGPFVHTCQPMWLGRSGPIDLSSASVANGVVYIGSIDGKLYAFDAGGNASCGGSPKICEPLWSALTGDMIVSSPAIANGRVYVGSNDGALHTYRLAPP